MKKVKILCNWCSSTQLLKNWDDMLKLYQLTDNLTDLQFVDHDPVDYYVIINNTHQYYIPEKSILFHMEPFQEYRNWGKFANPGISDFMYVGTHANTLNVAELHCKIPSEFPEIRKDRILSVLSGKNFMEGHKKRIDFVKSMELNNLPIDSFGRENYFKFKGYVSTIEEKSDFYKHYKYTFQCENNSEYNYATEKLWDSIICECLTFYWGCPNLEDHINPLCFVRLDLNNVPGSIATIKKAIEEDWWSQRIDIIRMEKQKIIDNYLVFPKIRNIIFS